MTREKPYLNTNAGTVFVESRRRYPNHTTFTWLYVRTRDGRSVSLGDPWPCIMPAKREVLRSVGCVLGMPSCSIVALPPEVVA